MRFVAALFLLVAVVFATEGDLESRLPAGWGAYLGRATLHTSFSCDGRGLGYYGDTDNDCQIFHMCVPFNDEFGYHTFTSIFSFICPNQTAFSQDALTCTYFDDAFPCSDAPSIYESSNNLVGVVPVVDDEK